MAVLVLVVLPLLMFVGPALAGAPALAGDNLIQNFPLRAFTGQLIREGHLPLWNPYIWSGSPLLGGLNAGSFYPLTFLFVVLPPIGAWVLNMAGVYWAGGLGMYALLRRYRLRPLPSLLGAVSYAFAGAMQGQMVHLGVIQGIGWMPLAVLAILELSWGIFGTGPGLQGVQSGPPGLSWRRLPWRWVVLLAAVVGLIVLTGEPRAMAELELVAVLVVAWLALRPYAGLAVALRRRLLFVGLAALAAVWGVVLSLAQTLPGWTFIQASQRASESYAFFGSGSLPLRWTSLLFVPDLFGGDGLWHQPTYFNSYNLPEVTGYVGLVPLAAALMLLTLSFGRRRSPRSTHWGLWLALGLVGLFATWGAYLPTGHLFNLIPLFGRTRLQSRNLAIVDLALAVLLAFWVDGATGRQPAEVGLAGWRRWVGAAPALLSALLCLVAIALPAQTESFFGADVGYGVARAMTPWLALQLVVALAVVALMLWWRRLRRTRRPWWLGGLVVVDVGLFLLATSTGLTLGNATAQPTRAQAAAVLGTSGRFAIYDLTNANTDALSSIGQPDLNVFTTLPSVQGYGSILGNTYGQATGSHFLDTLDQCALARGVFEPLRLNKLLVLPQYLAPDVIPVQSGQHQVTAKPTFPGGGTSDQGTQVPPPAPPCPAPRPPQPGTVHRRTFYFGKTATITGAELVQTQPVGRGAQLRVGLVTPGGHTVFPAADVRHRSGGWSVLFASQQQAVGLVVTGPARAVGDTSTVVQASGQVLALDGILQDALDTSGWHYQGTWDAYAVFSHPRIPPPVWIAAGPGAAGASVRQVVPTTSWGTEVDRVRASRPVTVIRSEAYMTGWHVVATPADGGASRDLPVEAHGLIQQVRVPAGDWTITFNYRAPHLTLGLVASALALAGFVAAGAVALVSRRRGSAGRRRSS